MYEIYKETGRLGRMTLKELKRTLQVGNRVKTCLNVSEPSVEGFLSTVKTIRIRPLEIEVVLNRGYRSNSGWVTIINEKNIKYFEILDMDWDP